MLAWWEIQTKESFGPGATSRGFLMHLTRVNFFSYYRTSVELIAAICLTCFFAFFSGIRGLGEVFFWYSNEFKNVIFNYKTRWKCTANIINRMFLLHLLLLSIFNITTFSIDCNPLKKSIFRQSMLRREISALWWIKYRTKELSYKWSYRDMHLKWHIRM